MLGAENPADMFTKHVDGVLREKLMKNLGLKHRGGGAAVAPRLVRAAANVDMPEVEQSYLLKHVPWDTPDGAVSSRPEPAAPAVVLYLFGYSSMTEGQF